MRESEQNEQGWSKGENRRKRYRIERVKRRERNRETLLLSSLLKVSSKDRLSHWLITAVQLTI